MSKRFLVEFSDHPDYQFPKYFVKSEMEGTGVVYRPTLYRDEATSWPTEFLAELILDQVIEANGFVGRIVRAD